MTCIIPGRVLSVTMWTKIFQDDPGLSRYEADKWTAKHHWALLRKLNWTVGGCPSGKQMFKCWDDLEIGDHFKYNPGTRHPKVELKWVCFN